MANARIVLAIGLVDGVNRVFRTPVPYVPGTTAYILNGRIHSVTETPDLNSPFGYLESNPDGGEITTGVAPTISDVVQIFFWDRKVAPVPPVTQLDGQLRVASRLTGVVRAPKPASLAGAIGPRKVVGVLRSPAPQALTGTVVAKRLIGVVKEK